MRAKNAGTAPACAICCWVAVSLRRCSSHSTGLQCMCDKWQARQEVKQVLESQKFDLSMLPWHNLDAT